jgi:cell division transport system ATP-binding protein
MIQFQKVSKIYPPNVVALEDINLKIEEKEFVLIAGRSGAGKTTLLKLILREEAPSKGRVFLEGQDIGKIDKNNLPFLRRKIGAVFQDYKLLPSKTIRENVGFVMEAIGADDEEIERFVPKVLSIVGLVDKMDKFPYELSSGEKQRAAIARALIHRPKIILADEPTGNLDPYNTSEIVELLLKINSLGTTVLLATHNKEIIKRLKRRTVLLKEGRLVSDNQEGRVIL